MISTLAIVTGTSRGLGQALAQELARNCTVLITIARHEDPLTAQLCLEHSTQYHSLIADLSDPLQLARVCTQLDELLQIHVERYLLINNAGSLGPVAQFAGLDQTQAQAIGQTFTLNITAPMLLCSHFLKRCERLKSQTQVINISSGAARSAYPGWSVYGASKAALDHYSEILKLEAPFAKIVSLAPGVVDTDMQKTIRRQSSKDFPNIARFVDLYAQQKLSRPQEVAQQILSYSLSPEFGLQTLADIRLIKQIEND